MLLYHYDRNRIITAVSAHMALTESTIDLREDEPILNMVTNNTHNYKKSYK